jgi:hypothetical protein
MVVPSSIVAVGPFLFQVSLSSSASRCPAVPTYRAPSLPLKRKFNVPAVSCEVVTCAPGRTSGQRVAPTGAV